MRQIRWHRRSFLAVALSLRCMSTLPRRRPITLGFSLYGMASLAVPEAIAAAAGIGYDDVEMACLAGYPGDPERLTPAARNEIRRTLERHGMRVSAFMENLTLLAGPARHLQNLERISRVTLLARDLGCAEPVIIETVLGGLPGEWDQHKEEMVVRLKQWVEVASAARTLIAIKPHVRNAMQTPSQAEWLRARIGSAWLRFTYDYSHFYLQNWTLRQTLEFMLPHTVFVHVKDASGTADQPHFQLPGEGNIDYVSYLRLLKTMGYRGSVTVEVSAQIHRRPGYDPIAAARRSYEFLAKTMETSDG